MKVRRPQALLGAEKEAGDRHAGRRRQCRLFGHSTSSQITIQLEAVNEIVEMPGNNHLKMFLVNLAIDRFESKFIQNNA